MTSENPNPLLPVTMNWNCLIRTGSIAALVIVALIPVQILIFVLFPPPESTLGFFELFRNNPFLGLLSLDLLYIFSNSILILFYLGLAAALRRTDPAILLIAVVLGIIGITAYYTSGIAFDMLSLSKHYYAAESPALQLQWLGAGHAALARYTGTAFNVYYILNAVALLLLIAVMFRDKTFSRGTAVWGFLAGLFMLVPSTAGTLGLVFSLLSLIPWTVFSLLAAKTLFVVSRDGTKAFS
ncbi:MAG: hypothetical protein JXR21_06425 [Candidatus Marinimicrobia bacterium]|nr:hypothetical protein [Candidatus Neomarinimicrobiota bacterium]